jgi:hypothetical protein
MAKQPTSDTASLGVRERMLLFASGAEPTGREPGTGERLCAALSCAHLTLTDDGRAALRAGAVAGLMRLATVTGRFMRC